MADSRRSDAAEPLADTDALSELLCFDLYSASRAVKALYRTLLADTGLTYPQYLALVILWKRKTQSVKQLAEGLRLDYNTLTPMLQRMQDRGLITRTRNAHDERTVSIVLTPAGQAMRERTSRVQPAVAAASGLDTDKIAALQRTLRTFTHSIEAATADRT